MTRFLAEFRRPMFFGDEGVLRTRAYRHQAKLSFVHEITCALPSLDVARRPLCATGIEEFALN
jgi:acyl-CoA thioesterase FadM